MNRDLAKCIGRAAREARNALHLTQEDAAERINVSVEFYARIERGKSLPSIVTFAGIVSALGVSADRLLGLPAGSRPADPPGPGWVPVPPQDPPELRRLIRRLRKASPRTVRITNMLTREIERMTSKNGDERHGEPE